jgi:hypothetical protein
LAGWLSLSATANEERNTPAGAKQPLFANRLESIPTPPIFVNDLAFYGLNR